LPHQSSVLIKQCSLQLPLTLLQSL